MSTSIEEKQKPEAASLLVPVEELPILDIQCRHSDGSITMAFVEGNIRETKWPYDHNPDQLDLAKQRI